GVVLSGRAGSATTAPDVRGGPGRFCYSPCPGAQGRGGPPVPSKAFPAGAVEPYVLEQTASGMPGGRGQVQPPATEGHSEQRQRLRDCVARIDYDGTTGEMAITLNASSSSRKDSA